MAEHDDVTLSPVAKSFAAHVRAFHAGLPVEEQQLLEQLFALAGAAVSAGGDVEGYAQPHKLEYYTVKLDEALISSLKLAGLPGADKWIPGAHKIAPFVNKLQ